MPDGVTSTSEENTKIALEVKYLSTKERSLRDPDRSVNFIFRQDVEQARKYLNKYKGGLLWVTNDTKLAQKYREEFETAGFPDARVVVVLSIQE